MNSFLCFHHLNTSAIIAFSIFQLYICAVVSEIIQKSWTLNLNHESENWEPLWTLTFFVVQIRLELPMLSPNSKLMVYNALDRMWMASSTLLLWYCCSVAQDSETLPVHTVILHKHKPHCHYCINLRLQNASTHTQRMMDIRIMLE